MSTLIPPDFGLDLAYKNPLVRIFGKGPEGRKCKECKHLFVKQYASRYYKCALRVDTNGPGSDHRANYPACSKFQPKEGHHGTDHQTRY